MINLRFHYAKEKQGGRGFPEIVNIFMETLNSHYRSASFAFSLFIECAWNGRLRPPTQVLVLAILLQELPLVY